MCTLSLALSFSFSFARARALSLLRARSVSCLLWSKRPAALPLAMYVWSLEEQKQVKPTFCCAAGV